MAVASVFALLAAKTPGIPSETVERQLRGMMDQRQAVLYILVRVANENEFILHDTRVTTTILCFGEV